MRMCVGLPCSEYCRRTEKDRVACYKPSRSKQSVNCIYVAASTRDARYTRICVASIRHFYPTIPIRLLAGGRLQRGLAEELHHYWEVGIAELSTRGDYGWGFVKLEVLFGPPGEKFLVLDSDTILTGSVLGLWAGSRCAFGVDDEKQSESETKRLYYDWEKLRAIDPNAGPPQFVFNSGQFFGTAGVLSRADFAPWVEWTLPRRLRHPEYFMPGEQGILNYVLNQKVATGGLQIDRLQLMRWPGHSLDGLDAQTVSKRYASPLVIHWAGMKRPRLQKTAGGNLLLYFERSFYARIRAGWLRRHFASCRHVFVHWQSWLGARIKFRYHRQKTAVFERSSRQIARSAQT
jgi:hypothetical protein